MSKIANTPSYTQFTIRERSGRLDAIHAVTQKILGTAYRRNLIWHIQTKHVDAGGDQLFTPARRLTRDAAVRKLGQMVRLGELAQAIMNFRPRNEWETR